MVDLQVDPKREGRIFPLRAVHLLLSAPRRHGCRWRGRYVGWPLLGALFWTVGLSEPALADGPERARADIRILGRLDSRPRVKVDTHATTILGTLTDEAGLPVAGAIGIATPSPGHWESCLGPPRTSAEPLEFPADANGRYCLRGPPLPENTRIRLRLSGDNHQAQELDVATHPARELPPRILSSPELIDLDSEAMVEVDAVSDGATRDGDMGELFVECQGVRTLLGSSRAAAGHFRFTAPTERLPGPGNCTLVVRAGADSNPRPIVLSSPATLRTQGWTARAGRHRAVIRVELSWRKRTAPLTVGVLEGHRAGEHVFTVPLSDAGEGVLDVDTPPDEALSIRLARAPVYVQPPSVFSLPAPVPWAGWSFVEGAGLIGLAAWLALSWRSVERKSDPEAGTGTTQASRGAPGTIQGRIVDTHTGHPIPARIEVVALGTGSKEVLQATSADSDGRFSLPLPQPGVVLLRLTAEGYVPFEGPCPAGNSSAGANPGPVIRLTQRRRAALSMLMAWFRGRPLPAESQGLGASPMPTPGEIQLRAGASGLRGVAEWAADVGTAAYGVTPPTDADLSALAERKPS